VLYIPLARAGQLKDAAADGRYVGNSEWTDEKTRTLEARKSAVPQDQK
jgi:hypothetical protein